jgi:hypothetical protein
MALAPHADRNRAAADDVSSWEVRVENQRDRRVGHPPIPVDHIPVLIAYHNYMVVAMAEPRLILGVFSDQTHKGRQLVYSPDMGSVPGHHTSFCRQSAQRGVPTFAFCIAHMPSCYAGRGWSVLSRGDMTMTRPHCLPLYPPSDSDSPYPVQDCEHP